MNRITLFFFCVLVFPLFFISCNPQNTAISGVWFDENMYNYWLKHPSESSPARDIAVDSKIYLAPPNAMIISIARSPMTISAAGGKWNIDWIRRISQQRIMLKISSLTNKSASGLIYLTFHSPKLMTIEPGRISIELRHEIDQSFLILDKGHNYIKCSLHDADGQNF